MITRENIKSILESIDKDVIIDVIDDLKDYVILEIESTNAGSYISLQAVNYNKIDEELVNQNGNLYTDKDDFLQILLENKLYNYDRR